MTTWPAVREPGPAAWSEARYFDVPASRMETIENNVKQIAPRPTRTCAPTKNPVCVIVAFRKAILRRCLCLQLADIVAKVFFG